MLSITQLELSAFYPCKHEEADTRMMLHLQHAAANGHERAYLRTVDTDVVTQAVVHSKLSVLLNYGLDLDLEIF